MGGAGNYYALCTEPAPKRAVPRRMTFAEIDRQLQADSFHLTRRAPMYITLVPLGGFHDDALTPTKSHLKLVLPA